jgi:hypothetical protein
MARQQNSNIEILTVAVDRLGPVADELVFLGGCATGLLITDPAAPSVRVTMDVDVITEVASLRDYYQLAKKLRQRGFVEDQSQGAPICRWNLGSTILDLMPTKPDLLGFGNRWYEPAVLTAESVELPSGKSIRMVLAPYFLATKLEAFDGRGKGDYLLSHDIEDIVAVLDGRPEILDEIPRASKSLRTYLADRFAALLETREFIEALAGHLAGDPASQGRMPLIKERIGAIARQKP